MLRKDTTIYVFLHIPKTGGDTIRYHIEKNFKPHERLSFYPEDSPSFKEEELTSADYHNIQHYFSLTPDEKQRYRTLYFNKIESYFFSLSQEQKRNIRVLYGHLVPYGVHRFFNRPVRYVTFLRRPLDRAISYYNFMVTQYYYHSQSPMSSHDTNLALSMPLSHFFDTSLVNPIVHHGEVISFKSFFETVYDNITAPPFTPTSPPLTTVRLLRELGYLGNNDNEAELELETTKNNLSLFYFIGITEKYNNDVSFLYYLLGINKFYEKRNVSNKYFIQGNDQLLHTMFGLKHTSELTLYDAAVTLNETFKKTTKHFYMKVYYVKVKRTIVTEHKTLLFLYILSAFFKKRFFWYARAINRIKGIT